MIGILRGAETEALEGAVEAVVEAGILTLEITLNRPEAFQQIALIKDRFRDQIQLGAGTVLKMEAAQKAIKAGAEFIVTPALILEVIEFCRKRAIPVFPGAMTPSEILGAHLAGAEMVKVFPASVLGPQYIKSLRGPFPEIKLIPTGGVTLASVPEYFKAGANALGVGGEIFKKEWLERWRWQEIKDAAKKYVEAVQAAQAAQKL